MTVKISIETETLAEALAICFRIGNSPAGPPAAAAPAEPGNEHPSGRPDAEGSKLSRCLAYIAAHPEAYPSEIAASVGCSVPTAANARKKARENASFASSASATDGSGPSQPD